ncbi:putative periplasmic membrane protein [Myxococcus hansupus]|uniref:Putative periplasmic membrane protein n=1 Tax=Pseudomyxococcus hansupus TaxID=1297742 RepID=A0A0H4WTS1_9BACT|nr:YdeI/OmpD-associated family protein [Myxococcus hansupus]AKQ66199.1 putative periplasmic membrane protein [Myxococcus hansupus]
MSPTKKAPAKKAPAAELPILAFATPADVSAWMKKHHASERGFWLKLAKKGSGIDSVTYAEALDVALEWGWIDGQKQSFDDTAWLQKFTPRGPRSVWSKVNCAKVEALIAAGRMKPSGMAVVEKAREDGRWDAAYESQSKATVPEDLAQALAANARAAEFFSTLNAANRYAILWRVHTAKKAETRARRIEQFVEMLARHESLHA